MNRFPAAAPVQVITEGHPRYQQAGVIHAEDQKKKDVEVKFDLDGEIEAIKIADLRAL